MQHLGRLVSSLAVAAALTAAAGVAQARDADRSPVFVPDAYPVGPVIRTEHRGPDDDLATAGLGPDGIQSPVPPPLADPLNPTAAELRRLAIYNNYRALVDTAPGGGYGQFFGPGEELVPGVEYLTFADRRRGTDNVTLLVQIPDSFDPSNACIVTGPSSGSRGVYGAIGTSGEWGLQKGCAVAYTDMGTGTGAHDLSEGTVNLIQGERAGIEEAGDRSNFTAPLKGRRLAMFNAAYPDRFAFKHAHSKRNPEQAWGTHVLLSVRFAFEALNREYPGAGITPENTVVIASSISNGGGSSVLAAEMDRHGLIDGVAVAEPNVNPRYSSSFVIQQGDGPDLREHSRPLYDYFTLLNVYQGCANSAPELAAAPLNLAPSPARCAELAAMGLLAAGTLEGQAREAQAVINGYGILEEQNILQPSHWFINVPQSIAVTYANAYGRFGVEDALCGYGFADVDATGAPQDLPEAAEQVLFATSNGIPPTGGVDLANEDAPGGPLENRVSTPSQNLDGALCLRRLYAGANIEEAPADVRRIRAARFERRARVVAGVRDVLASGDLNGTPAVFVTGRSDAILPPNHTSRAYVGLNRVVEGSGTNLCYYEILNAQHLDVLNGLPGFSDKYVPLHRYFLQALDLMHAHLTEGEPLPPSQVVRTTPRGLDATGVAPPLTEANVPPVDDAPDRADLIRFTGNKLKIPE